MYYGYVVWSGVIISHFRPCKYFLSKNCMSGQIFSRKPKFPRFFGAFACEGDVRLLQLDDNKM